jgi:hypothetical protein
MNTGNSTLAGFSALTVAVIGGMYFGHQRQQEGMVIRLRENNERKAQRDAEFKGMDDLLKNNSSEELRRRGDGIALAKVEEEKQTTPAPNLEELIANKLIEQEEEAVNREEEVGTSLAGLDIRKEDGAI